MSAIAASSLQLPARPTKLGLRRAGRRSAGPARAQRRSAVVRAAANRDPQPSTLQTLGAMLEKYDFVSAGLGALAVTTFFVARGQDPGTALWITAAATVTALLVNDACDS